jgi:hypothetical protein
VVLARDFLRPGAPSSSPELRRRAASSTAASRRPRRPWSSPWCPLFAAERPSDVPVAIGEPQHRFLLRAAARRRCTVAGRAAAGCVPQLLHLRVIWAAGSPSDGPRRVNALSKLPHTGQPITPRPHRSPAVRSGSDGSDLLPYPQPRDFAKETLSFSLFTTRSSHLRKPLRLSPVFFCFSPKA